MTTGVILLAGGKARRFGADKRIARLPDGQWLIMAAIENIARSGLPLLVCLGADDAGLQRALRAGGIACIKCADSHLGMGSTLAEGIAAIDEGIARANHGIQAISESPYLKAVDGDLTVAFVPYENLVGKCGQ